MTPPGRAESKDPAFYTSSVSTTLHSLSTSGNASIAQLSNLWDAALTSKSVFTAGMLQPHYASALGGQRLNHLFHDQERMDREICARLDVPNPRPVLIVVLDVTCFLSSQVEHALTRLVSFGSDRLRHMYILVVPLLPPGGGNLPTVTLIGLANLFLQLQRAQLDEQGEKIVSDMRCKNISSKTSGRGGNAGGVDLINNADAVVPVDRLLALGISGKSDVRTNSVRPTLSSPSFRMKCSRCPNTHAATEELFRLVMGSREDSKRLIVGSTNMTPQDFECNWLGKKCRYNGARSNPNALSVAPAPLVFPMTVISILHLGDAAETNTSRVEELSRINRVYGSDARRAQASARAAEAPSVLGRGKRQRWAPSYIEMDTGAPTPAASSSRRGPTKRGKQGAATAGAALLAGLRHGQGDEEEEDDDDDDDDDVFAKRRRSKK